MSGCARCGAAEALMEFRIPWPWEEYLKEEYGVRRPVGEFAIPLCANCYATACELAEECRQRWSLDPELHRSATAEWQAFVDAVDTTRLIDDVR